MLNSVVKKLSGKEIILFNRHRNSKPLLNRQNREKYLFLSPHFLIKFTALFGRSSRRRYRMMAVLLSLIDPVCIIDINWTARHHRLYYVWCTKNEKQFIVLQHGAYTAGILKDIKEKYVACNTFLVWGEHFKKLAEKNNPGKKFHCIVFGNPVYNEVDREVKRYKKEVGNKILVAVTVIEGERLEKLREFLKKMETVGFDITVKEHAQQVRLSEPIGDFHTTKTNLYTLLKNQEYDIVLTDVSSAMLDSILFKNRALYFSPSGEEKEFTENVYEKYLVNLALNGRADRIREKKDLLKFIDIEQQEKLLQVMTSVEKNDNRLNGILTHR